MTSPVATEVVAGAGLHRAAQAVAGACARTTFVADSSTASVTDPEWPTHARAVIQ